VRATDEQILGQYPPDNLSSFDFSHGSLIFINSIIPSKNSLH